MINLKGKTSSPSPSFKKGNENENKKDRGEKKKDREKLLAGLFIVIIAFGIGFLLLKPSYSQVKNLRTEVKNKEESLAAKQRLFEDIKQLQAQYEEIQEKTKRVLYALPQQADVASLLVQLEAIASQNGMIFESVDFQKEQIVEERVGQKARVVLPYKTIEIRAEVTGSYNALKNYLKAVESNVRLSDVESIVFSPAEKAQELNLPVGTYSFSLKINSYYQE